MFSFSPNSNPIILHMTAYLTQLKKANPSDTTINLERKLITAENMLQLTQFLHENCIQSLKFFRCGFEPNAIRILTTYLKTAFNDEIVPRLASLSFERSAILQQNFYNLSVEDLNHLIWSLENNKHTLTQLSLDTVCTPVEFSSLNSLEKLNVSALFLSQLPFANHAEGLSKNKYLTELKVLACSIASPEVLTLSKSNYLKSFYIYGGIIEAIAVQALCQMPTLENLLLPIGEASATLAHTILIEKMKSEKPFKGLMVNSVNYGEDALISFDSIVSAGAIPANTSSYPLTTMRQF